MCGKAAIHTEVLMSVRRFDVEINPNRAIVLFGRLSVSRNGTFLVDCVAVSLQVGRRQ